MGARQVIADNGVIDRDRMALPGPLPHYHITQHARWWWEEAGGHYDIDSCNGEAATPPDHFKYPGGWYMGSIFVKAGCTLYMFRESNYEGDR